MLREIPWPQFLDWLAFDEVDPIGGARGDWQAGMISAMMMNAAILMRTGKVDLRFQPRDFLLKFGGQPRKAGEAPAKSVDGGGRQTWQEQKMVAQMFAALARADANKKNKRR